MFAKARSMNAAQVSSIRANQLIAFWLQPALQTRDEESVASAQSGRNQNIALRRFEIGKTGGQQSSLHVMRPNEPFDDFSRLARIHRAHGVDDCAPFKDVRRERFEERPLGESQAFAVARVLPPARLRVP